MIEEHDMMRVVYLTLAPRCGYCGKKAKFLRIAEMRDGEMYVSTLCKKDMHGESNNTARQGFVSVEPESKSYFVNPKVQENGWVQIEEELRKQIASEEST